MVALKPSAVVKETQFNYKSQVMVAEARHVPNFFQTCMFLRNTVPPLSISTAQSSPLVRRR